jgi:hypothetical protein
METIEKCSLHLWNLSQEAAKKTDNNCMQFLSRKYLKTAGQKVEFHKEKVNFYENLRFFDFNY